jgi:hypothetical protein
MAGDDGITPSGWTLWHVWDTFRGDFIENNWSNSRFLRIFYRGHDCFGRVILPQGSNAEAAPESILQNATGCEDAKPSRRRMRDLENERNCVQMQSGVLWVPS